MLNAEKDDTRKGFVTMKVLLLNGSPKANGNTALALKEMAAVFAREGIEAEIIHVGNKDIRGCIACGSCAKICPDSIITVERL